MHAAALLIEIRIPGPRSLKAKRAALRPLLTRLRKLDVAVSEVDHQNAWQRAAIGVAVVAPQMSHLNEMIEAVKRVMLGDPNIEVLSVDVSYLERP